MAKRFLKLNLDNDEADFLAFSHPNAFILLYFIAKRARRIPGQADGLNVGECHIGDWESMGLSRQNYRTALKVLCQKKILRILETNRTRKNSTTGITTSGTKVLLLNSMIWDINQEEDNHLPNHCLTTAQPLPNHEEERIRKKKKEKEEQPQTPSFPKIKFRENVQLTQAEFDSLTVKHGQDFFDKMLDALDSYKGSTGKKYISDFHVMKEGGWVIQRVKDDLQKITKTVYNTSTDRRTKDINGIPVSSPYDGRF